MSQLPIRFAVVGLGHIGKRHAEMIKRNSNCSLVAVADIDSSLEKSCQEMYNVPFFNSIETLIESGIQIDVINVCTPNGSHAETAIKALESKHHVVLEKPMGLSKASCEEVIYKSLHMSKQVFCVMQNRYSPPSVWMKSLMDQKILGDIYMVQVNCYWNRDDRYYKKGGWKGTAADGGPLFTQFSHFMDLMYWCFGDITDIKANFANFNHTHNTIFKEDSGFISFKFVNGGMGTFNYSTSVWDKNLESSMTIVAEKGSVKVGGQYMDKVEYCHIENYSMPELPPTNPPNDYGPYKGSAANHHYIIENVVEVLTGQSTITTNALEGLKVVDIIERIYHHL